MASDIYFGVMVFGPLVIAIASFIGSIVVFSRGREARMAATRDDQPSDRASLLTALGVVLLLVPFGICACYGYALSTFDGR